MYRTNRYRWWNVIAFAAVIAVNVLANVLPIGGRTTGEISDRFYTEITPAGYAFSIWSLIYLLLAGFVVYQFRRFTGTRDSVLSIGIWFILSCVFNIAWLLLWHYLIIEWSVLAMLLLLLTLWIIYRRTRRIEYPSAGEVWLVKLPFSIYFGWICAAFLVNIAVIAHNNSWSLFGMSETALGIVLLAIGAAAALLISFRYRDAVLPLVFVWAYTAIANEHKDMDKIMVSAFILAAILFISALWLAISRARERD